VEERAFLWRVFSTTYATPSYIAPPRLPVLLYSSAPRPKQVTRCLIATGAERERRAMTCAALDGELELQEASSAGPAAVCWRRRGGERVVCAVCDILTATSDGSALLIHHYPLVRVRDGCAPARVCAHACALPRADVRLLHRWRG
jgi:hypothetical protein